MKKLFIASGLLASLLSCNIFENAKQSTTNKLNAIGINKIPKKSIEENFKKDSAKFNGSILLTSYKYDSKTINKYFDENWQKKENFLVDTYFIDGEKETPKGTTQVIYWNEGKKANEVYNFMGKREIFYLQYHIKDTATVWNERTKIFTKVFPYRTNKKLLKREWKNSDTVVIDSGYSQRPKF